MTSQGARGGDSREGYLPPASHPNVVLYDQYNNPDPFDSATSSQVFGDGFGDFDDQAADDFIVPGGQSWSVNEVDVLGYYDLGGGPAASVNVYFYLDSSSLPGAPVVTQTNLSFSGGNPEGSLLIPTAPVTLRPGHYWVSVQVNQDYDTLGQWLWADRAVQSNSPAAWRNPGDGFDTGCLDWDWRGTGCGGNEDSPDQVFRLLGTLTTVTDTPTPTGTPPTPTPTACVSNYAYSVSTGATIVPGTVDTLNHCVDCTTLYNLPFPYTIYGQTYTRARIGSNGTFQFTGNSTSFEPICLPDLEFGTAIFALWDDLDTGFICEQGCGVYSSVSGTAPNRIANIEWRTEYVGESGGANFEVRLYEGQQRFDIVYGQVDGGGANSVAGVQRELGGLYTQYSCQTGGITQGLAVSFTMGSCSSPSATPAQSLTPTPTNSPTSTPTVTQTGVPTSVPTRTSTPVSTHVATSTPVASSTPCPMQFTDVPQGSAFYPFVRCLTCLGILSGYADNTFRPNTNVTRGQAAKIVANTAGYGETIPATRQTFNDVPGDSPFWLFVERVALHGVISGYSCGGPGEACPGSYFRPGNNITRGQLAKVDAGVAGYNEQIPPARQTFADVAPGSAFWLYVERVALHNVISGYSCGGQGEPCPGAYFRPNNNVTRGQAAKIVANTFIASCSASR
jgi:hypothetical protein